MTLEDGLTKMLAFERTNKPHSLTGLRKAPAAANAGKAQKVGD